MLMDLPMEFYANLQATPGAVVGWLHTLMNSYAEALPWPTTLIFGPHTFMGDAPTFFETVALYLVDKRMTSDMAARQVVLSVTCLPLCHPEIGLDLRVWPLFPASLETLKFHFFEYFTQASPVLSSAAALYYVGGAPPLACNRWLFDQLETPAYADATANSTDAARLYPAWIEQYRALRGDYPADPRRSFRALLTSKQRRTPKK
jgi:hypothetical protein